MYFSNLPLGARFALAAANMTVRKNLGMEQPELFLESHGPLSKMKGVRFSFITKYSTVDPERNRIVVRIMVEREVPLWRTDVPVQISVRGEVVRGASLDERFEENFSVVWVRIGNPLGSIFHYPKVVMK